MFGMENHQQKSKPIKFEYDLEKKLNDTTYRKQLENHVIVIMNEIKSCLREGVSDEVFKELSTISKGFEAINKLIYLASKK